MGATQTHSTPSTGFISFIIPLLIFSAYPILFLCIMFVKAHMESSGISGCVYVYC
jgi:hypothetical protein